MSTVSYSIGGFNHEKYHEKCDLLYHQNVPFFENNKKRLFGENNRNLLLHSFKALRGWTMLYTDCNYSLLDT